MPANMISEPAGSSLNVTGNNSATVSAGPMPGKHAHGGAEHHADEGVTAGSSAAIGDGQAVKERAESVHAG